MGGEVSNKVQEGKLHDVFSMLQGALEWLLSIRGEGSKMIKVTIRSLFSRVSVRTMKWHSAGLDGERGFQLENMRIAVEASRDIRIMQFHLAI